VITFGKRLGIPVTAAVVDCPEARAVGVATIIDVGSQSVLVFVPVGVIDSGLENEVAAAEVSAEEVMVAAAVVGDVPFVVVARPVSIDDVGKVDTGVVVPVSVAESVELNVEVGNVDPVLVSIDVPLKVDVGDEMSVGPVVVGPVVVGTVVVGTVVVGPVEVPVPVPVPESVGPVEVERVVVGALLSVVAMVPETTVPVVLVAALAELDVVPVPRILVSDKILDIRLPIPVLVVEAAADGVVVGVEVVRTPVETVPVTPSVDVDDAAAVVVVGSKVDTTLVVVGATLDVAALDTTEVVVGASVVDVGARRVLRTDMMDEIVLTGEVVEDAAVEPPVPVKDTPELTSLVVVGAEEPVDEPDKTPDGPNVIALLVDDAAAVPTVVVGLLLETVGSIIVEGTDPVEPPFSKRLRTASGLDTGGVGDEVSGGTVVVSI
jgi:hypothetical protein